MLKPYEHDAVNDILRCDNSTELVKAIIYGYAEQSVQNAKALLDCTTKIASIALKLQAEESSKLQEAGLWLISQVETPDMKKRELFAAMTPVCKALFPKGYPHDGCPCDQDYFKRFIGLLKDKSAFSWKKDKVWSDLYGYTEYLQSMEKLYGDGINGE